MPSFFIPKCLSAVQLCIYYNTKVLAGFLGNTVQKTYKYAKLLNSLPQAYVCGPNQTINLLSMSIKEAKKYHFGRLSKTFGVFVQ